MVGSVAAQGLVWWFSVPPAPLLQKEMKSVLPPHSEVIFLWFSWGNKNFKKSSPGGLNVQPGLKPTASVDWELMNGKCK